MTDVAVASVAVAGLAVVTSGVVSLLVPWLTSRRAAELARENRTQQRLADSYLDMLRIVEREGLALRAQVYNLDAAAREDKYDPIPRMHVPAPEVTDQATIAAILAAFGSTLVRDRYDAWRTTVLDQETVLDVLRWNWQEAGDPMAPPTQEELAPLREAHDQQVRARAALADAVAGELGHR